MNLFMLVQPQHLPIPEDVHVNQNFGRESVVVAVEGEKFPIRLTGECIWMTATPEAFAKWLGPFDGVWITTNPQIGQWQAYHVKPELVK